MNSGEDLAVIEEKVTELEEEVERLRARLLTEEACRWGGDVGDGLPAALHVGYVYQGGNLVGMFQHANEEPVELQSKALLAQGFEVRTVRYLRVEAEA